MYCPVARLRHFARTPGTISAKKAFLDSQCNHVVNRLTGLALGIGDFLERPLYNSPAEHGTSPVKTIQITTMRFFKQELDSPVGNNFQPQAVYAAARQTIPSSFSRISVE